MLDYQYRHELNLNNSGRPVIEYRAVKRYHSLVVFVWILFAITTNIAADSDHGHAEEIGILKLELFSDSVYFSHIHGVSFLSESSTVALAAHDGLWLYNEGKWKHNGEDAHDYMGFAPFDGGFYAGGHPDLSTELPNPLGLVKVYENGAHVEPVAFSGEYDFHLIASGRSGQSIYLYIDTPSQDLQRGLYYSTNFGARWQRVDGYPVREDPVQLSAHPTQDSTIALIAGNAAYLTVDYGQSFTLLDTVESPTAITFHPDGRHLLIGRQDVQKLDLTTDSTTPFPGPHIGSDVFTHISINSYEPQHIAATTNGKSVWLTIDSGTHWTKILENGRELN